ncbi:HAD-IA family hydrolase [Synechococcus sp. AH-601-J22]|nr:HAD-IA family hydrolase [Synechococcus sp. AH-601-J22]
MKTVAFDFDGVIINSISAMEAAWSEIKMIFPEASDVPFSSYLQFVGMPFPAIMQSLSLEACMPRIQDEYFRLTKKFESRILLYEDINPVLDFCNTSSYLYSALVTSKSKSRTLDLCDYLNLKFDLIVCPEDTLRGKPNPDPLLYVNKHLSCSPLSSLYIGDMVTDYSAAVEAGWDFVYADWGYGKIPENSSAIRLKNPKSLLTYLRTFA